MIKYERPTGPCIGGCQPGANNLKQTVLFFEQALAFNGCYVCRPPRGLSRGYSTHAEGRAIDFSAKMPDGKPDPHPVPEGSAADTAIKKWMWIFVATSDKAYNLGVQRFIYKRTEWVVNRGTKILLPWSSLAREHANHLHVELTKEAAQNLTPVQIRHALGLG